MELEEKLPSVRLYFFKKFHILTRTYGRLSQLPFLPSANFDNKAKAVKDSNEVTSNVIEEYQVIS